MKKFMSVLLTMIIGIIVTVSCSVTAFAAEPPKDQNELAAIAVERVTNTGDGEVAVTMQVCGYIVPLADINKEPDPPDQQKVPGGTIPDGPKTGDNNQMELYLILGLTSLLFLVLLLLYGNKEKKQKPGLASNP